VPANAIRERAATFWCQIGRSKRTGEPTGGAAVGPAMRRPPAAPNTTTTRPPTRRRHVQVPAAAAGWLAGTLGRHFNSAIHEHTNTRRQIPDFMRRPLASSGRSSDGTVAPSEGSNGPLAGRLVGEHHPRWRHGGRRCARPCGAVLAGPLGRPTRLIGSRATKAVRAHKAKTVCHANSPGARVVHAKLSTCNSICAARAPPS
jgi:hypothetical protein